DYEAPVVDPEYYDKRGVAVSEMAKNLRAICGIDGLAVIQADEADETATAINSPEYYATMMKFLSDMKIRVLDYILKRLAYAILGLPRAFWNSRPNLALT